MNNLVATWHHAVEVDVRDEPDAAELLSRAHDRLIGIPELEVARRLVDVAREHVAAWCGRGEAPAVISTASAGRR
jgi:hypothetical protein